MPARHIKLAKDLTRQCIATQRELPKAELIRFVLDQANQVTPDIAQKLPGRGLWISAKADALHDAIAQNTFSRAAKRKARLPDNLAAMVQNLLLKHVVHLIALARKSGCAVQGFETVKATLAQDKMCLLLQASDGSKRQLAKLRAPSAGAYITVLRQDELGLAFARDYVIHAAITGGGLSNRIKLEANRLAGFRFLTEND